MESQLWEHPLVSRLGYVKQLGIATNVFPGATHTRLSHSLGTMHYADKLASAFVAAKGATEDKHFRTKLRIAGLLHDIGHPAFSHNLELWFGEVFDKTVNSRSALEGATPFAKLKDHPVSTAVSSRLAVYGDNDPFDNSISSWFLIRKSPIGELLSKEGIDPDEIASIVAGIHGKETTPSAYNQILDSGLDADKLDYLQRDGYATGVRYGTFDVDQILKSVGAYEGQLCVDEDAIQPCVHLTLVRYLWYSQVIYNKNLVVFEQMLRLVYESLVRNGMVPTPVEVLDMLQGISQSDDAALENWRSFTDDSVIQAMEQMRRKLKGSNKIDETILPRDVLRDFIERIVWRRSALRTVARVDYVEGSTWVGKHPRGDGFGLFRDWVQTEKKDELAAHRIIMKTDTVRLTKDEAEETPIMVMTAPHDDAPVALQSHYGCILQQFSGAGQTKFTMRRLFAVPELADELSAKWNSIPESAAP